VGEIIIVKSEPCHAEAIYAIECESFPDPWSESSVLYEIKYLHSICLTAKNTDNTILGHITMRHVINEGHINNIAVAVKYRKCGVGNKLLEAVIAESKRRNLIGLTLEVRVSNTAAISLYKKHGFVIEGRRKNYYRNPGEDAHVMWLKLADFTVV